MSYETLLYEVSEHVATITFNRPEKMNTWNAQVASELSEAMLKANTDDEVRAIVLTGAGRAFCAGADFVMLGGMLAGALLGCVLMALMMANAGGAWDNAKKFVEKGNFGGKGTETHSATVVGDTVGDPFKDTSGPAMNILINVMAIVSLVIAPLL